MTRSAIPEVDFDEFEVAEAAHEIRRMQSYSERALEAARPIARILVAHPKFRGAIHAMDRIFQLSREVDVPYGMLLLGPPGTGKSALGSLNRPGFSGGSNL